MKRVIFLCAAVLMLCACTVTNPRVSNQIDVTGMDFTDKTLRKGKDCSYYVLGLLGPFGDNNVIDAAKNGNIKQTKYVDYEAGYYVFFSDRCTVVYGN